MLRAHHFAGFAAGPKLIVLGAVHGNEIAGTRGALRVLAELDSEPSPAASMAPNVQAARGSSKTQPPNSKRKVLMMFEKLDQTAVFFSNSSSRLTAGESTAFVMFSAPICTCGLGADVGLASEWSWVVSEAYRSFDTRNRSHGSSS